MKALVLYDQAHGALAELASLPETVEVDARAAGYEAYYEKARNGELVALAVRVRKRAQRRCGQLLIEMETQGARAGRGGDRRSKCRDGILKLADLKIDPKESRDWQALARLDDYEFEARLAAATKEVEQTCRASAAERIMAKRERRAARERELGAKIAAWPTRRYGVIYCDPAWKFETHSENGLDRAADNHYPTMTLEAIMGLDVPSIAADDCVIFMWVTRPFLMKGGAVLAAWGFEYKSCFVWDKIVAGNGYWNLDDAEILLIGTRGDVPCPAMGDVKFNAMQHESKARHSAKPQRFAEIIETYFPSLPKIELNRRGAPRPGWDAWGNEAEGGEHD